MGRRMKWMERRAKSNGSVAGQGITSATTGNPFLYLTSFCDHIFRKAEILAVVMACSHNQKTLDRSFVPMWCLKVLSRYRSEEPCPLSSLGAMHEPQSCHQGGFKHGKVSWVFAVLSKTRIRSMHL